MTSYTKDVLVTSVAKPNKEIFNHKNLENETLAAIPVRLTDVTPHMRF